jgi:hypothetical protein
MPLGEKDVGKGAPVGKRIQSRLVLMNSGRLRVAANTLLFSDSILAFATDQLSKYTAVTTSARRTARRAARIQWSECSSEVFLGGRLGIVLVSLWGQRSRSSFFQVQKLLGKRTNSRLKCRWGRRVSGKGSSRETDPVEARVDELRPSSRRCEYSFIQQ